MAESNQRTNDQEDRGMQIILTHENADFDAISSLLAAHKIYTRTATSRPFSRSTARDSRS